MSGWDSDKSWYSLGSSAMLNNHNFLPGGSVGMGGTIPESGTGTQRLPPRATRKIEKCKLKDKFGRSYSAKLYPISRTGIKSLCNFIWYSYTPRTLRACCSQSELTILKIHERSARALFLYNCTPNTLRARECSVGCIHMRVGLIHLLLG